MEKYDKYIKELNQKVERQRDQQKKRDEEFEERLKQLQEDVSLHRGQIQ
jgi:predicted phage gp36 major capsid-like protein